MSTYEIVSLVFGIASIVATFVSYYLSILCKIKSGCEDAINNAEDMTGSGQAKLDDAVAQVYALIPAVVRPLFTKTLITKLVQSAFDKIKSFAEKQNSKNEHTN